MCVCQYGRVEKNAFVVLKVRWAPSSSSILLHTFEPLCVIVPWSWLCTRLPQTPSASWPVGSPPPPPPTPPPDPMLPAGGKVSRKLLWTQGLVFGSARGAGDERSSGACTPRGAQRCVRVLRFPSAEAPFSSSPVAQRQRLCQTCPWQVMPVPPSSPETHPRVFAEGFGVACPQERSGEHRRGKKGEGSTERFGSF